jgi:hypothetical protein
MNRKTGFVQNSKLFFHKSCVYLKLLFYDFLKFRHNLDTTLMEKHFWIMLETSFSIHFFYLPLKTFCLKTSLFHQIHPPKFYFCGSITRKLTFKTKISKFTCILIFFRSYEQKLNFL